MIKRIFGIIIFSLLITFFLSAKSNDVPNWFLNKNSVFPSEIYISGLGEGKTEELAKNDAVSEISRYLKTNIKTSVYAKVISESNDNENNFSQKMEEIINISSSATLSELEYTKAYYEKKEKLWYCVAYIKRDDAWNLFLPKIENEKSNFYAAYNNGLLESEPILKYSLFSMAFDMGKEFQEVLNYARIIHPKNEEKYSNDRETLNNVHNLLLKEKNKCTLFIKTSGDYGNIVKAAITDIFSRTPFVVVGDEFSANYKLIAIIEDNKIGTNPISISPSANIEITSKQNRSICVVSFHLESKTTAYSLEKARKKAYPQLAEVMKQNLVNNLPKFLNVNKE